MLAERLDAAHHGGLDVDQALHAAMDRPLPDEQPAAALRWRLTEQLDAHHDIGRADQPEPAPKHSSGGETDDLLAAAGLLDWTSDLTAAPDLGDLDLPGTEFPGADPGYDLGL
ncbi:hypothetical protein A5780_33745 [Nocardia sp. 852002-20019_SCH5090214]|nr:hypothetical protein A5780_33745 [Nocardia sp. 852002-20019_SCH5090214]